MARGMDPADAAFLAAASEIIDDDGYGRATMGKRPSTAPAAVRANEASVLVTGRTNLRYEAFESSELSVKLVSALCVGAEDSDDEGQEGEPEVELDSDEYSESNGRSVATGTDRRQPYALSQPSREECRNLRNAGFIPHEECYPGTAVPRSFGVSQHTTFRRSAARDRRQIDSRPDQDWLKADLSVVPDGDGGSFVEIEFEILTHMLGDEHWGAMTDLGSCIDEVDAAERDEVQAKQQPAKEKTSPLAKRKQRPRQFGDPFAEFSVAPVAVLEKAVQAGKNTVNMSHYGMGPSTAAAIAHHLAQNQDLKNIGLAFNNLGDAGVAAISSALTVNNALRRVDLRGNSFGQVGCSVLADALLTNSSLTLLNVRDCR